MADFNWKGVTLLIAAGAAAIGLAVGFWHMGHGGAPGRSPVAVGRTHGAPRPPVSTGRAPSSASPAAGTRGRTVPAAATHASSPSKRHRVESVAVRPSKPRARASTSGRPPMARTHPSAVRPPAGAGSRQSVSGVSLPRPTQINMTFSTVWHPMTFEIGPASPPPPVRFVCPTCPPAAVATTNYVNPKTAYPPPPTPSGNY